MAVSRGALLLSCVGVLLASCSESTSSRSRPEANVSRSDTPGQEPEFTDRATTRRSVEGKPLCGRRDGLIVHCDDED